MIQLQEVSRIMKASGGWCEKTCYLCGNHFQEGDSISLVVPPYNIKKQYKRLSLNAVIHTYELNVFCNQVSTVNELYDILGTYKKPKKPKLTDEQKNRIQLFAKAAFDCGYRNVTFTSDGCKCKQNRSSDTLQYNVYSDRIRYYNNRKRQLFDFLINKQITANVYNKFHQYLKDGKINTYNAANEMHKIMTDTINSVNNMLR